MIMMIVMIIVVVIINKELKSSSCMFGNMVKSSSRPGRLAHPFTAHPFAASHGLIYIYIYIYIYIHA